MFNSLKKKLKSWLGKPEEEKPEVKEKTSKKTKEVKEKPQKPKKDKKTTQKDSKKELPTDEELKEIADQIPDSMPEKFETGQLKSIPDTEKVKKEIEELEESQEETKKQKKGFFSRLTSKFTTSNIKKEQVEELFEELELILLENNVALEVVDKIKEKLIEELVGQEVKKSELDSQILTSLKNAISEVLIDSPDLIKEIKEYKGTYVIIFFGINGTGKTTSIAKLAYKLKKEGISVALAAADTFRAASIEQIQLHADKIGVPLIKQTYGTDPTAVAFDAKKYSQKNKIKCLLIDTAGRMYTKENLIKQMEKMIRVIQPNRKIFVGESIAGNDSIEQAKTFNEAIGIDGLILSKADVDEKGGTPLSVTYVTGQPILFLGVGQTYDDLEPFNKQKILKNLGLD